MKNRFIRTLSPITAVVISVLDVAVAFFAVLSVSFFKTEGGLRPYIFLALEIFAVIVAILVTKEVLLGGIVFREDEIEFNMIDEDNVFLYCFQGYYGRIHIGSLGIVVELYAVYFT